MPRFRVGISGFLVTVVTFLASLLSILAIAVRFMPALDDVRYLKDAIDVYVHYLRTPVLRLTGLLEPDGTAGVVGILTDLFFFWVAFFAAVNVFTYRHEGGLLPSHIYANHCQYHARGTYSALVCVVPRLLLAFAAAPIVCTVYALTKSGAPKDRLYSAAYMTIQPREVLGYLVTVFGSAAIILLLAQHASHFYM